MNPLQVQAFVAASFDVPTRRIEVKFLQAYERSGRRTRWASGLVDSVVWVWLTVDVLVSGDWVRLKDTLLTDWKGSGE